MIEKTQFRNMTAGFVGAVQIGPDNKPMGVPVGPGDTIWLSEDEQVLTANAPRRPEDNPFIPQTMQRRNKETDALEDIQVTPLVATSEARYVPANERLVPAQAETTTSADAEAPVSPPTPPAPEPPAAPAPEPTPEAPPAPSGPPVPSAPTPPGANPDLIVPDDEGRAPQTPPAAVEEEVAAVSPGPESEETGAAVSPTGVAPQGEYQAGEEVGTPSAPAQDAGQQPPAPWTPDSDG